MDEKNKELLARTIYIWTVKKVVKVAWDVKMGSRECPFCQEYVLNAPVGLECVGCPIYSKTGQKKCKGTPYESVLRAVGEWHYQSVRYPHLHCDDPSTEEVKAREAFIAACNDELTFLMSLEEEDAKPE